MTRCLARASTFPKWLQTCSDSLHKSRLATKELVWVSTCSVDMCLRALRWPSRANSRRICALARSHLPDDSQISAPSPGWFHQPTSLLLRSASASTETSPPAAQKAFVTASQSSLESCGLDYYIHFALSSAWTKSSSGCMFSCGAQASKSSHTDQ